MSDRRNWSASVLLASVVACATVAPVSWLPMVRVPDTSVVRDLRYLPGVMPTVLRGITAVYPLRMAYCLYGSVVNDTITVTAARSATIARADAHEIVYRHRGCDGSPLGMALGRVVPGVCLTTETDDVRFFRDERLLFLVVICADGAVYYRARHTDWWARWHSERGSSPS